MAMEKFLYTTKDGKKISLPRFENIPFGVIRKLRKEPEAEQFFGLLEAVASKKDLDVIDGLMQEEVGDLMDKWQKNSGVELGES